MEIRASTLSVPEIKMDAGSGEAARLCICRNRIAPNTLLGPDIDMMATSGSPTASGMCCFAVEIDKPLPFHPSTCGIARILRGSELPGTGSTQAALPHKPFIVVAAIGVVKGDVPDNLQSFGQVREFLTQLREGYGRTDRFYLGQIPSIGQGRYFVHLDSLHTVALPPEAELQPFLRSNRIAVLSDDFRRDLHLRVLECVADLGFDDYGWLANEDLQWLLEAGDAELFQGRATVAADKVKMREIQSSGAAIHEKESKGREAGIAKREQELGEFEQELELYRQEARRRGMLQAPAASQTTQVS